MNLKITVSKMPSLRGIHHLDTYRRALEAALPHTGLDVHSPGVISFVLVTPHRMTELNAMHLHHEGTTDVITYDLRGDLAFSEEDAEEILAEIYICPKVAIEFAEKFGTTPSHELLLYAVHGMLHLAGEDDLTDEARVSMRAAEARVMNAISEFSSEIFIPQV